MCTPASSSWHVFLEEDPRSQKTLYVKVHAIIMLISRGMYKTSIMKIMAFGLLENTASASARLVWDIACVSGREEAV